MRIRAVAILFTASAAAAFPLKAQSAEQDQAPLPQFMSSAARAELAQRSQPTKPVADETRQAAEVLSARFAGSLAEPNPDAGVSKPGLMQRDRRTIEQRSRRRLRRALQREIGKPGLKASPLKRRLHSQAICMDSRRTSHPTPYLVPMRDGEPVSSDYSPIQPSGTDR